MYSINYCVYINIFSVYSYLSSKVVTCKSRHILKMNVSWLIRSQCNNIDVFQRCPDLLIGADTVVAMEDEIFEKPTSKQKAFEMLSR